MWVECPRPEIWSEAASVPSPGLMQADCVALSKTLASLVQGEARPGSPDCSPQPSRLPDPSLRCPSQCQPSQEAQDSSCAPDLNPVLL